MATHAVDSQLEKLQAENQRLRRDNERLQKQQNFQNSPTRWTSFFRKIAIVLCVGFAVILLVLGNLFFWAGNTIVKTDAYVAATAPVIKNVQVQSALAASISQKFFDTIDVDQVVASALPPKADFLAPTIASNIRQNTQSAILKVLQRPQFQNRWNTAQAHIHDSFIKTVDEHGSDGSISLSEIYSDISQQFNGTKLAFLANKPLPAKVGTIQLAQGRWLQILQLTIQNIARWRIIALLLLVVFSGLGIWLSRSRRKAAIILGSFFAGAMFLSLLGIRVAGEIIADKVNSQNADAARAIFTIVTHSLVIQTVTIFCAALVMIFVTWISGNTPASRATRAKIQQLFSGKLHEMIFSHGENAFTKWIGAHKPILEWLVVILVAATILVTRLTPTTLIVQLICLGIIIVILEILAPRPSAEV